MSILHILHIVPILKEGIGKYDGNIDIIIHIHDIIAIVDDYH